MIEKLFSRLPVPKIIIDKEGKKSLKWSAGGRLLAVEDRNTPALQEEDALYAVFKSFTRLKKQHITLSPGEKHSLRILFAEWRKIHDTFHEVEDTSEIHHTSQAFVEKAHEMLAVLDTKFPPKKQELTT